MFISSRRRLVQYRHSPQRQSFHITLDPSAGNMAWTSDELDTSLIEVPLASFGTGITATPISGDTASITEVAFALRQHRG